MPMFISRHSAANVTLPQQDIPKAKSIVPSDACWYKLEPINVKKHHQNASVPTTCNVCANWRCASLQCARFLLGRAPPVLGEEAIQHGDVNTH